MIAFPVVWFIVQWLLFNHIPSAASTLFSARFNSDSRLQCWNHTASIRFGGWIQQFFSGNINLIPHLRAIIGRLLQNIILVRSLRSNFIDSFSFTKKRCNYATTLRKVLAPFCFSHVIDYCSFFSLSLFFFSFFLDFYGKQWLSFESTAHWLVLLIIYGFNGSEIELQHLAKNYYFGISTGYVIKQLVHAFSCTYSELWMHLGSLESTQEARVALGCASSNSYTSLVLSKLPACIHNSMYAR